MKRKSLESDACAIARSLDVIGDWWSLLIVRDALSGIRRFSEFQRSLGAAKNILTTRLRALVAEGILKTAPASDGSAFLEYVVTEKGKALMPVIVALAQWGDDYLFSGGERKNVPVDKMRLRPLARLQLVAHDGRKIAIDDIVLPR